MAKMYTELTDIWHKHQLFMIRHIASIIVLVYNFCMI